MWHNRQVFTRGVHKGKSAKEDERDRRVKNTRGKGRQAVEGIIGGAVEEARSAQSGKAVRIMEHLG